MILCVGLATVDLVYRVDRVPGVDEKAQATAMEIAAGGPAANAAITAAALGAPVTLLTAIGAHPLGDLIRADLTTHGVRILDAAPDSPEPPPVSAITVLNETGQRTIVSRNAGNRVVPAPPSPLPDAEVTLADGHHPALALAAAKSAHRLVIDAGTWRPIFTDLFAYAEVVACSAAFRHPKATRTTTDQDAATAAAIGAPHVLVTHGPDPVRWFSRGTNGAIPVPPVTATDTAGAGDVFHGALTAALAGYFGQGDRPATQAPAAQAPAAQAALAAQDAQTAQTALGAQAAPANPVAQATPATPTTLAAALIAAASASIPDKSDLSAAIGLAIRVAGVRVAHPGPRAWLAEITALRAG